MQEDLWSFYLDLIAIYFNRKVISSRHDSDVILVAMFFAEVV